ncbi:MAG: matrixin family metalloprotease [Pseudomonadota bacterium]|nr:matrixin family metalloprotease [Pseudomonadota bacterium]
MTVPLYRSSNAFHSLPSCLLAIALSLLAPVAFAARVPVDDGIHRDLYPALGISDVFGRWNEPIRLVYDPDGAPAEYSDNSRVLALLQEAYSYWMYVSGVRFEIVGVDPAARDDRNLGSFQRDGLVRVSWENIGGFAGRAGPTPGPFNNDLGYSPYEDGSVELNRDADAIASDFDLVSVLIHELGHLLGLGHSDMPHSVMYANPYNHLRYPRADDIRAMQVLYGPPAQSFDPDQPIAAWLYSAPPQASAAATQFLFKPNAHPNSRNGAYFRIGDAVVTDITAATDDDEFLVFFGGIGNGSTIGVDANLVVVDPTGYIYDERAWRLACSAPNFCVANITIGKVGALKTLPGTWKVHVVDPATNQTLVTTSIPVSGAPVVNRAPTATITAVPGDGPAQARFTLTASDPDGDSIDVVWRPPGLSGANTDVRRRIPSGGSTSLDVDFSQAGTHTFFVEARDTAPRYGNGVNSSVAGEGFQTLLRVTVTLPEATVQVVSTQDAGTQPITSPTKQMLAAIASTVNPSLVANTNGANAVSGVPASFTYGASANGGATTRTTFSSSHNVIVAGGVQPQIADVGKAGDIFIVVRTILNGVETWTYRNASGEFVPWPTVTVAHLQPAYSVSNLQPNEAFEILNGNLMAAEHRVYIGYRPSGSNTLLYTGDALRLYVSN